MGCNGGASGVDYGSSRRARTPQDNLVVPNRVHRTSGSSDYSEDGKVAPLDNLKPVDLFISNLDPGIGLKDLRKMLTNMVKEYAMVCVIVFY